MIKLTAHLRELSAYFLRVENHRDDDPLHVSIKELRSARSNPNLSEEARRVAEALIAPTGYSRLRSMQSEGFFNDGQVSMRDLYAATRGKGYGGESVKPQQKNLFVHLSQYHQAAAERAECKEIEAWFVQEISKLNPRKADYYKALLLMAARRRPDVTLRALAERFVAFAKVDVNSAGTNFEGWVGVRLETLFTP